MTHYILLGKEAVPCDHLHGINKCGACYERDVEALRERVKVLEDALSEAIEDIEEWGAYASDYFKDKHGLAECLAKHRAALAIKEVS